MHTKARVYCNEFNNNGETNFMQQKKEIGKPFMVCNNQVKKIKLSFFRSAENSSLFFSHHITSHTRTRTDAPQPRAAVQVTSPLRGGNCCRTSARKPNVTRGKMAASAFVTPRSVAFVSVAGDSPNHPSAS